MSELFYAVGRSGPGRRKGKKGWELGTGIVYDRAGGAFSKCRGH